MALAILMILLSISWGLAFAAPALIEDLNIGSNPQTASTPPGNHLHNDISPAAAAGPALNKWSQFTAPTVSSGGTIYSGRATSIAVNASNPLNLYVGASLGGVWKSTDGGTTWSPLTDSQPSLAVGALALSPDQKTIYAGTGDPTHTVDSYYGAGMLKSSDGGRTWSVLGVPVFSQSAISAILVSQSNPNRILAADTWAICCKGITTVESPSGVGVFLSTDGGNTWTKTLSSPPNHGVASLAADTNNPNTVYAGDFAGAVYRSTDGGASWSQLIQAPSPKSPGKVVVAVTPTLTNQVIFAFTVSQGTLVQIARFNLANGSIVYLPTPPAAPGYSDACGGHCDNDLVMVADPSTPNLLYFGALDIYRSTDGGQTWTDLGGYSGQTHPGQHVLTLSPAASSTIFLGNDGGIWKSSDRGTTWGNLNAGLGTLLVNTIAFGPNGSYLAGTKDNGCLRYTGGNSWNQLLGGDGGWMGYEANKTSVMYCTQPRVVFQKSMDGGNTWHWTARGINTIDPSVYYVPVVQYPNQSQGIYLATNRIYNGSSGFTNWTKQNKWNNVTTWSDYGGNLNGGSITALAVAPSNKTVWWLGDSSGNIKISATSRVINKVFQQPAANWQPLAAYNGYVTGIAVNASKRYQAYASVVQLGVAYTSVAQVSVIKLTRTITNYTVAVSRSCATNGCVNLNVTTTLSTPIIAWKVLFLPFPGPNINVIKMDRATNYLYVGTDIGVYFSSDAGNTWKTAGVGLPNVPVYDMAIDSVNHALIVATQGRGVWSLPLLSTVTLTLSYSIQGGGPNVPAPTLTYFSAGQQKNVSLSGSPSPFTVDFASSWSVTNPLAGGTASQRFTTSQPASGTATSSQTTNLVYYNQYLLMFNYTLVGGGKGFTPPTIQFSQFGSTTSASAGTINWADAGTTYTYPTTLLGSSASERWSTATPTGTIANSVPVLPNFFHQYLVSLSYLLVGGGGPSPPTILTSAFGSAFTQSVTLNSVPYWLDAQASYSVTNPLQGSGNSERWYTFTATGSITSSGPLTFSYYNQYLLTVTGANLPEQWFTVGTIAKFNITGVFGRSGGTGNRLISYTIDGQGNTSVPATASPVTISVPMGSPHKVDLKSVAQYQVNLGTMPSEAISSITPPTVPGDNYWYDSGTAINLVLNGVWNRTSYTGTRLSGYSVNGGDIISVSSLQPVKVLSSSALEGYYSVSARTTPQYLVDTSSGSLSSVSPPSIKGDAGWYDQGASITAIYNYVWNNQGNQSRLSATGYSIGGANHTLSRLATGGFKVGFKVTAPTAIIVNSVQQYLLKVSGVRAITLSMPSPTGDGYYDSGSNVTVSTNYVWNLSSDKSRDGLTSFTLDGVTTNVTRAEAGNFTTPPIQFRSFHSLTFNSVKQFFVNFQFADNRGSKTLTPSSFQIKVNGQLAKITGTQLWLDNGSQFTFLNIVWGGTNVSPLAATAYSVTGPTNVVVQCRVFDVTIRTVDALGLPVAGATANIVLANGTQISAHSDADGSITLPLVPLGRFDATISNLGASARISGDASAGSIAQARVPLSFDTIGLIIGVVAAIAGGSIFFLRRRRGRKEKEKTVVGKEA
jgi:hypothetical protein